MSTMKCATAISVILLGYTLLINIPLTAAAAAEFQQVESLPPDAGVQPNASNVGPIPNNANASDMKCECAVFGTEAPAEDEAPVLTQAPMVARCDPAGEESCRKICALLAEAAKERGPHVLCSHLGHYNNLQPYIHSRVCAAKKWTYTGLSAPYKICCHDGAVAECPKESEGQPPQNKL